MSTIYDKHPELAQVAVKYFTRTYSGPVDESTVWDTLENFNEYAQTASTYAYPGQLVTILNDSDNSTNKDPLLVVVRNDGTTQILGQNTIFESIDDGMSWLLSNAGTAAVPGVICTIKYRLLSGDETYGLFAVNDTVDGFIRVTFTQDDLPEIKWSDITDNPFSEDEDNRLNYTDTSGTIHKLAYVNDLNKPPVLESEPESAEEGNIYYQKL